MKHPNNPSTYTFLKWLSFSAGIAGALLLLFLVWMQLPLIIKTHEITSLLLLLFILAFTIAFFRRFRMYHRLRNQLIEKQKHKHSLNTH